MMRAVFIFFFTIFELFSLEYESVEFKGNKAFFSTTLSGILGIDDKTKLMPLRKDKNISIDDISEIQEGLVDFYNSKGYYKCDVNYEVKDKNLIFNISEEAPVKVKSITLTSPISLKQFITLAKGDIFDADKYVEMKQMIRRHLDEQGYPKSKIQSTAMINIDPYEAVVELNVTNFTRSKVSKIIAPALPHISTKAIKNKLTFKEGDFFDIREIEKSRENLYMTDMFYSVKLEFDENDESDENITIKVELQKAKEKSIKVSLGYSTDNGPRVKFSWINKNMFDDFRRVETSFKFTQDSKSVDGAIFIPNLLGMPFENRVAFTQDRFDYLGYSEIQLSNTFRFAIDILSTKHFFGLKTERGSLEAESGSESEYIKNQQYVTNAILYEYLLDRRDSKIDPTRGFLVDMNVEFANNIFASSLNYMKMRVDASKMYSPPKNSMLSDLTLALKGSVGVVDDLKTSYIPIFKRYFAGGSFSNRGYQYKRMGPQDGFGNYIGAKTVVDLSYEARYKITPKFSSVIFYDTTMLDYDSFGFHSNFKPSIGIGVRYETGVGPVRFDIGVPLDEEKRGPVYHISFGQAF